jgi:hypothetical protein
LRGDPRFEKLANQVVPPGVKQTLNPWVPTNPAKVLHGQKIRECEELLRRAQSEALKR